ncbi:MAG: carbonic anhydrase family protein [Hyphomicrobiaceae bacterium]
MTHTTSYSRAAYWTCFSGALVLISSAVAATATEKPHWGYGVRNGPAHWSAMNDKFKTCGTGKHQSPIDIPRAAGKGGAKVTFDYQAGSATVVNNGHTIQVNVAKGSKLSVGKRSYRLVQFHFHTPSENTVDGLHYPMETHLVHADEKGRLAVVALMVRIGDRSLIDRLPKPTEVNVMTSTGKINPAKLLPSDKSHYAFTGSLTTPPCSEGVNWIVMKEPVEVTNATVAEFYAILGANNRPTNPRNGREISLAK